MAIPTNTYYANLDIANKNEPVLKPITSPGIIDVVTEFAWSASPIQYSKGEYIKRIPKVYLTEYSQELNALIASALYLTNQGITDTFTTTLNFGYSALNALNQPWLAEGVRSVNSFFTSYINNYAAQAIRLVEQVGRGGAEELGNYLESYRGLYFGNKTGFNYVLPYLTDTYLATVNNFNTNLPAAGFISKGIDKVMDTLTELNIFTNILEPGTFIERPKHYQFSNEGSTIVVRFPLLNTVQTTAAKLTYQQNYEFLWLLAFQNKPYRTSFSRVLPPKLYQLTIPGQEHFPYSYISNMNVELVGNRRLLPVVLPGGHKCDVPIPEAYNVTITFTSLLAQMGNMMITDKFHNSNITTYIATE